MRYAPVEPMPVVLRCGEKMVTGGISDPGVFPGDYTLTPFQNRVVFFRAPAPSDVSTQ
jgi:hypothetical protein